MSSSPHGGTCAGERRVHRRDKQQSRDLRKLSLYIFYNLDLCTLSKRGYNNTINTRDNISLFVMFRIPFTSTADLLSGWLGFNSRPVKCSLLSSCYANCTWIEHPNASNCVHFLARVVCIHLTWQSEWESTVQKSRELNALWAENVYFYVRFEKFNAKRMTRDRWRDATNIRTPNQSVT